MSVVSPFKVMPLAFSIHALSAVTALLISQTAVAIPVIGDMTIDERTPVQSYEVSGVGSKLTTNVATTRAISVGTGAEVELNGSVVAGGAAHALTLDGATAAIEGSNISSDTVGLSDQGGNTGADVGPNTTLTLQNTNVVGAYADSVGLHMQGGSVRATNQSVIRGGDAGAVMAPSAGAGAVHTLILDNSHVEGETGSAIVVGERGAVTAKFA